MCSSDLDVTDEKLLQREHSRLFRAYDMLRRSAEVARSAEDPHALFLAVLRVAVEVGGYRMAWIGTLDPETRIIRPVAQVGDTTGYLEGIAVPIDDMNLGSGPVGRAVHTRRPAISRNIHVDTGMAPWRARAIAAGFCSVAAFPIVVDEPGESLVAPTAEELDSLLEPIR